MADNRESTVYEKLFGSVSGKRIIRLSDIRLIGVSTLQDDDDDYWVVGKTEEEARENAVKKFNVSADKIQLRQGKAIPTIIEAVLMVKYHSEFKGDPAHQMNLRRHYTDQIFVTGDFSPNFEKLRVP